MNKRERMVRLTEAMDEYETAIRNHAMAEAAIKAASRELDIATAALDKYEQLVGSRMDDVYEALTDGEESSLTPKTEQAPPHYPTDAERIETIRAMERASISEQETKRG